MGNKTRVALTIEIEDKWLPQFMGFLDSLNRHSRLRESGLLAFNADCERDFEFVATVHPESVLELARSETWGCTSWEGKRDIDRDKVLAPPVLKDMECPKYCYGKVDEVYDRE